MAGGDELVTNKEESLSGDIETEDACGEGETSLFFVTGNVSRAAHQTYVPIPGNTAQKLVPISLPLPSGQMDQRMISVTEATATILSLSPSDPPITLALSATLSIIQSRRGEVKTCCHPVDSFTLREEAGRRRRQEERDSQSEDS